MRHPEAERERMSDRAKEGGHRRQSKERAWRSEEASTHMISGGSKVVIEVEDQDRAKAFWIETMGFELAQDAPYQE
jgi:hypothetical protein